MNDPSAGSPTDTVLRLDHSLDNPVNKTSKFNTITSIEQIRIIHHSIQSIDATGGVYKGQGRIQLKLVI
jgi:hypothetical protein